MVLIKKGANEASVELAEDENIALLSATGSCAMGKAIAPLVSARLGRNLLELGGNNAAIVCPTADLDLTIKGVTFSAAGTTGQRCTTLRRLFVHEDIYEEVINKLIPSFESFFMSDKISSANFGFTPANGSSNKSISGSLIIDLANSSNFF